MKSRKAYSEMRAADCKTPFIHKASFLWNRFTKTWMKQEMPHQGITSPNLKSKQQEPVALVHLQGLPNPKTEYPR